MNEYIVKKVVWPEKKEGTIQITTYEGWKNLIMHAVETRHNGLKSVREYIGAPLHYIRNTGGYWAQIGNIEYRVIKKGGRG